MIEKMNSQTKYSGNIHWWIILILWGFYVYMIFAYIYQWGNNPVNKASLINVGVIWITISVLIFDNRFVLTIDNVFVKFKSASWGRVKIHITQIKDVSVVKMSFFKIYTKPHEYHDFTGKVIKIQTKSGKIYQIAIRNAERIKEEIEKRMITINND